MLAVAHGGGLRVSELLALGRRSPGKGGKAQLSIIGKGGVVRQVLLPKRVSDDLLALRGEAGSNDPVFPARHGGIPKDIAGNCSVG